MACVFGDIRFYFRQNIIIAYMYVVIEWIHVKLTTGKYMQNLEIMLLYKLFIHLYPFEKPPYLSGYMSSNY